MGAKTGAQGIRECQETPVGLILLEQELIERQPPETRQLWWVVMAFVPQLLASTAMFLSRLRGSRRLTEAL